MKQKQTFFERPIEMLSALVLAVLGAVGFHALREFWVFYDPNIFFLGGSMGLFLIAAAAAAILSVLLVLRVYASEWWQKSEKRQKALRAISAVVQIIGALILIYNIVMLIIGGAEIVSVFCMYFKKDVPFLVGFAFLVALCALPKLHKQGRMVVASVLVCSLVLGIVGEIFPLSAYRFAADPVVMDTGKDYAVVFATADTGTAYVHYSYEGEEHTVYAENQGRRIGDRLVHSIHIPYEHLKNNTYTIGSTRVIEQFGYGSRLGKTITAGPFKLAVNEGDTQRYLVLSDWHTHLKQAQAAVHALGAYDGVVMLGDPAGSMQFEEQAMRYVVQFGGDLTHGAMPVFYVRGNHETRGAFAADFATSIGYERLYYTAQRGQYHFLMLDSGEDKEDAHVEYGGMVDYERYRAEMLQWLQALPKQGEKLIVFSHAWQICEPQGEAKASRAAWDSLQRLGARLMVSGHTHTCEFLDEDNPEAAAYLKAYPDITTYIDGGHSDKTGVLIASKLTLSPERILIEAADDSGNRVIEKALQW